MYPGSARAICIYQSFSKQSIFVFLSSIPSFFTFIHIPLIIMLGKMMLWSAGVILPALVEAYSTTNEVMTFLSVSSPGSRSQVLLTTSQRPDLTPPKFEFTTLNQDLVAPGYILMAPYTPLLSSSLAAGSVPGPNQLTLAVLEELAVELAEAIQNGPYVFDQRGVCILLRCLHRLLNHDRTLFTADTALPVDNMRMTSK
jgi:hypothetical protein